MLKSDESKQGPVQKRALTEAESRWLLRAPGLDAIRNRIAEARPEGFFALAERTPEGESPQEISPEGVPPSDLSSHGMSRADVIDAMNVAADLIGPVNVLQSESEVPAAVREQAAAKGYTGRIEGFEYQGEIYVVADNLKDGRHAQARALANTTTSGNFAPSVMASA